MKKVLLPIADGCEEIEAVTTIDILRRGGVFVNLVSTTQSLTITGRNNIKILADTLIKDSLTHSYDMLIIPGGTDNVNTLRANKKILDLVKQFLTANKFVAAICAGPLVLKEAGVLAKAIITSHPGVSDELKSHVKEYLESKVVVDGLIITSRGAGTAEAFALALLNQLTDDDVAMRIKQEIVST